MSAVSKSIPAEPVDTAKLGQNVTSKPEYQHYIPQFLLRNFSFNEEKPKNKREIYTVKLNRHPPKFVKLRVRRTFGTDDIYQDESKFTPKEQRHIEDKLGHLERATSHVIRRITAAHKDGHKEAVLSRSEKDLLRKFLFVMKYRGPNFFRRFNHQTAEDYNADDKEEFCKYMRENNLARPLDVWFRNLTAILDTDVNADKNWVIGLLNRMYPGDALWLFINTQTMHITLCTPSDPSEEFILTGNSFGLHEGPVSFSVDRETGKSTMTSYTEYHNIAVISPNLMILLRHNTMPDPIEDKDRRVQIAKEDWITASSKTHGDPEYARSLLEGLPVTKAKSSGSTGEACLFSGDGDDNSDFFHFKFFGLSSRNTQMLNSVMLDQGCHTDLIVYKTQTALKKALEFYLDMPPRMNGMHSMKTISDLPDDPIKLLLDKLENIAHELGSSVKARYYIDPLWEDDPRDMRAGLKVTRQDSFTSEYNKEDEDDSSGYEDIILKLLSPTPPVMQEPIRSSMEFLIRVIEQLKFTVEGMYAVDLIRKGSGELEIPSVRLENILENDPWVFDFPHTVLRDIQRISQRRIHLPQDISLIPLHIWRLSWYELCSTSFNKSGRTVASAVQAMRRICAESDDPEIRKRFGSTLIMGSKSLHKPQSKAVEIGGSSQNVNGARSQNLSGLSRDGISRAFDQIGEALTEEQNLMQLTRRRSARTRLDQAPKEQNQPSSVQPMNRFSDQGVLRPEHAELPEKSDRNEGQGRYQTKALSKSSLSMGTDQNQNPIRVPWTPIFITMFVVLLLLLGLIQLVRLVAACINFVGSTLTSLFANTRIGFLF